MALGHTLRSIFNAAAFPVRYARVSLQKNAYNPYVDFLCAAYDLPRERLLTYTRKELAQGFSTLNKSRSFSTVSYGGQTVFWAAYAAVNAAALPLWTTAALAVVSVGFLGLLVASTRGDTTRAARRLQWMDDDREIKGRLDEMRKTFVVTEHTPR